MDKFWEEEFSAFLHALRSEGWRKDSAPELVKERLAGSEAVGAVADALLSYWAENPTLENYAIQVNGASSLFRDPNDRRDVIARMNHVYVSSMENALPDNLPDCYAALQFWNGLKTPEVLEYFERLSGRFAQLVMESGQVGSEMTELLESRNLSSQMKSVRRRGIEALRGRLKTRMNLLRSPLERMEALLEVATDVGGPRILDDELWAQAENWALQAADAGGKSYLNLRDVMDRAADSDIAERPREVLAHINRLQGILDQGAQYGIDSEPEAALSYWRGKHFEGIPDEVLLRLYAACLADNPALHRHLKKDLPMLRGRERAEEFQSLLSQESAVDEGERRHDGFAGRQVERPAFEFDKKKWILGGLAILILLLLLGITWMIRGANRDEEKETETPSASVEPTPNVQEESTPKPTEKPAEREEPTATPKPTPSPTASPTPEPTPEPTPTLPEESEELPESEDIPASEEMDDIDEEGLIEVVPSDELAEEIPVE